MNLNQKIKFLLLLLVLIAIAAVQSINYDNNIITITVQSQPITTTTTATTATTAVSLPTNQQLIYDLTFELNYSYIPADISINIIGQSILTNITIINTVLCSKSINNINTNSNNTIWLIKEGQCNHYIKSSIAADYGAIAILIYSTNTDTAAAAAYINTNNNTSIIPILLISQYSANSIISNNNIKSSLFYIESSGTIRNNNRLALSNINSAAYINNNSNIIAQLQLLNNSIECIDNTTYNSIINITTTISNYTNIINNSIVYINTTIINRHTEYYNYINTIIINTYIDNTTGLIINQTENSNYYYINTINNNPIPYCYYDPCQYRSIYYSKNLFIWCINGYITNLTIINTRLTNIPIELTQLTKLQSLILRLNNIDNPSITTIFPSLSIGNWPLLHTLIINSAGLIGPIPLTISVLSRLEYLDLSNNYFNSFNSTINNPITALTGLTKLKSINLSNNRFNSLYSNITLLLNIINSNNNNIESIDLSNNNNLYSWTGSIPNNINLPKLLYLNLAGNSNINGIIPIGLCDNSPLIKYINFNSNSFTNLPSNLYGCTELIEFRANSNKFYNNQLPLFNSYYIEYLDLSNSLFTGIIPIDWLMPKLKYLLLNNNLLTGSILLTKDKFPLLQYIDLSINSFNLYQNNMNLLLSTISSNIIILKLNNNKLNSNWINNPINNNNILLPELREFNLHNNQLNCLPNNLFILLPSLISFDISNNSIISNCSFNLPNIVPIALNSLKLNNNPLLISNTRPNWLIPIPNRLIKFDSTNRYSCPLYEFNPILTNNRPTIDLQFDPQLLQYYLCKCDIPQYIGIVPNCIISPAPTNSIVNIEYQPDPVPAEWDQLIEDIRFQRNYPYIPSEVSNIITESITSIISLHLPLTSGTGQQLVSLLDTYLCSPILTGSTLIPNTIFLIKEGYCDHYIKSINAIEAGATALLIYTCINPIEECESESRIYNPLYIHSLSTIPVLIISSQTAGILIQNYYYNPSTLHIRSSGGYIRNIDKSSIVSILPYINNKVINYTDNSLLIGNSIVHTLNDLKLLNTTIECTDNTIYPSTNINTVLSNYNRPIDNRLIYSNITTVNITQYGSITSTIITILTDSITLLSNRSESNIVYQYNPIINCPYDPCRTRYSGLWCINGYITNLTVTSEYELSLIPIGLIKLTEIRTLILRLAYTPLNKPSYTFPTLIYGNLFRLKQLILTGSVNGLSGILPRSLSVLQYLEYLDLSDNSLTVLNDNDLHLLFNPFRYLTHLILARNSFTGLDISQLLIDINYSNTIQYIDVSVQGSNQITNRGLIKWNGLIPELINLPKLKYLNLAGNSISGGVDNGAIPIGLCRNSPYLRYININENQFTGLPLNLYQCRQLIEFRAGSNSFNGQLPLFASPSELEYLDLSNSLFTGIIPIEWNMPKLKFLLLNNNELNGELILPLLRYPQLQYIDLSNNHLNLVSNSMELFLSTLSSSIIILKLNNNKLLSFWINSNNNNILLPELRELNLHNNQLSCLPINLFTIFPRLILFDFSLNSVTLNCNFRLPPIIPNSIITLKLNSNSKLISTAIPLWLIQSGRTIKLDAASKYYCPTYKLDSIPIRDTELIFDPGFLSFQGCQCESIYTGIAPDCNLIQQLPTSTNIQIGNNINSNNLPILTNTTFTINDNQYPTVANIVYEIGPSITNTNTNTNRQSTNSNNTNTNSNTAASSIRSIILSLRFNPQLFKGYYDLLSIYSGDSSLVGERLYIYQGNSYTAKNQLITLQLPYSQLTIIFNTKSPIAAPINGTIINTAPVSNNIGYFQANISFSINCPIGYQSINRLINSDRSCIPIIEIKTINNTIKIILWVIVGIFTVILILVLLILFLYSYNDWFESNPLQYQLLKHFLFNSILLSGGSIFYSFNINNQFNYCLLTIWIFIFPAVGLLIVFMSYSEIEQFTLFTNTIIDQHYITTAAKLRRRLQQFNRILYSGYLLQLILLIPFTTEGLSTAKSIELSSTSIIYSCSRFESLNYSIWLAVEFGFLLIILFRASTNSICIRLESIQISVPLHSYAALLFILLITQLSINASNNLTAITNLIIIQTLLQSITAIIITILLAYQFYKRLKFKLIVHDEQNNSESQYTNSIQTNEQQDSQISQQYHSQYIDNNNDNNTIDTDTDTDNTTTDEYNIHHGFEGTHIHYPAVSISPVLNSSSIDQQSIDNNNIQPLVLSEIELPTVAVTLTTNNTAQHQHQHQQQHQPVVRKSQSKSRASISAASASATRRGSTSDMKQIEPITPDAINTAAPLPSLTIDSCLSPNIAGSGSLKSPLSIASSSPIQIDRFASDSDSDNNDREPSSRLGSTAVNSINRLASQSPLDPTEEDSMLDQHNTQIDYI